MAADNNSHGLNGLIEEAATSGECVVPRPLSYQLRLPPPQDNAAALQVSQAPGSRQQWWHHYLYRNVRNQPPKILYSRTKEMSEVYAGQFLNESVIGFDMEWPWDSDSRTRLQDKVGLIQIASETKIALFHIGLHIGKTTSDLIAPTLRSIIESPDIVKTGVNIINADFSRLKKHFDIKPQAGFELSHLHHLVTYGEKQPELVTTKLAALAKQVQSHLGLPLWKGSARTSDWSKPLNQQQITYAADDAYAGLMLYHCMNAKRLAMDPAPPLPVLADEYATCKGRGLLLQPLEKGALPISAQEFFKIAPEEGEEENVEVHETQETDEPDVIIQTMAREPTRHASKPERPPFGKTSETAQADGPKESKSLDGLGKELFERLKIRRVQLCRDEKCAAYIIAHNTVLEELARCRPSNQDELSQIRGIGKVKLEKYGQDWLKVISQFTSEKNIRPSQLSEPQTPVPGSKRRTMVTKFEGHEPESSPQLHTGLSFTMDEATIHDNDLLGDDSDSSAFGPPIERPAESHPKRQRVCSSPPEPDLTPSTSLSNVLSRNSRIFENKLRALSRAVAAKLNQKPQTPIVSEAVIRSIVIRPPRTNDELLRIPGIVPFVRACAGAKLNLLEKIVMWTPVPPLGHN